MVRLLLRNRLMCLRTGTVRLVGTEGWKGTGDLVQDKINVDLEEMEAVGAKNKYKKV